MPDDVAATPSFSVEQRKALAQICQIHERGISPQRFGRRALRQAATIFLTLAAILLLNMTAFAAPGYLFLGFVVGALLKHLRILRLFRRIWPVYEAIIDWPRAFQLLKSESESEANWAASKG